MWVSKQAFEFIFRAASAAATGVLCEWGSCNPVQAFGRVRRAHHGVAGDARHGRVVVELLTLVVALASSIARRLSMGVALCEIKVSVQKCTSKALVWVRQAPELIVICRVEVQRVLRESEALTEADSELEACYSWLLIRT